MTNFPGDVDGLARGGRPVHGVDRRAEVSFYDWYADLPIASPQVFGDQTDVPEPGDWWDAAYLMLWGSNMPVGTRTPDAHWMTAARYRGVEGDGSSVPGDRTPGLDGDDGLDGGDGRGTGDRRGGGDRPGLGAAPPETGPRPR
ncbi:hypothetical protein SCANM63S_07254 [Streptomyces canarius]